MAARFAVLSGSGRLPVRRPRTSSSTRPRCRSARPGSNASGTPPVTDAHPQLLILDKIQPPGTSRSIRRTDSGGSEFWAYTAWAWLAVETEEEL
jgi:hypothetical protein